MRGAIERLGPLATIYLCGVSYDPFVSKRLSMLYRMVRLPEGAEPWMMRLTKTLAAIRPVTTSQLLGTWLGAQTGSFTFDEAASAVERRMAALPPELFVDPELRRNPHSMVRAALPLMVKWQILERDGDGYRLAAQRRHPQFPFVEDILAYQAALLGRNARKRRLRSCGVSPLEPREHETEPIAARRPLIRWSAPITRCAGMKRSIGVRAIARRDAAMRQWPSYRSRDVGIRYKFAKGERCDGSPGRELQGRTLQLERQIETSKPPCKYA